MNVFLAFVAPPAHGVRDPRWELLVAIALGLFLLAVVMLTWQYPLWTTLLLAVALWIQWRYRARPGDGVAMLAAALLGTPAEMVEVSLGEWIYHGPHLFWGIPVWIPLIWANLFALFRRLSRAILETLVIVWPMAHAWVWKRFSPFLGVLILAYWGVALLWMEKISGVIALYATFMLVIGALWHRDMEKTLFVVGAVLGTVGEYLCIQAGYWHYHNPFFKSLGVDITLPLDWGLSAILIHRIAVRLTRARSPDSMAGRACQPSLKRQPPAYKRASE